MIKAASYLNNARGIISPIYGVGEIPMAAPDFNGDSIYPGLKSIYMPRTWTGASEYCGFTSDYLPKGTMSFWFKPDGWSCSGTAMTLTGGGSYTQTLLLFYKQGWAGGNAGLHGFYFQEGIGMRWEFYTPTGFFLTITSADNAMTDGTWYHWALVWERGVNPSAEVYKNGVLVGSANFALQDFAAISRVREIGSDNFARTNQGGQGWFAGFRHSSIPKRDFKDRFDPRADLNDLIIT